MVTVVTAYFEVPSKHSPLKYQGWIKTFLTNSEAKMVIFTDPKSAEMILKARGFDIEDAAISQKMESIKASTAPTAITIVARDDRTIIVVLDWTSLPLAEYQEYFRYCHTIDGEKGKHSPEVYRIWNAKPFLLEMVISDPNLNNPFGSEWFVFVDIGCCREVEGTSESIEMREALKSFPSLKMIEAEWPTNRIVLHSVAPSNGSDREIGETGLPRFLENRTSTLSCKASDRIQGGFFGGSISAVKMWKRIYLQLLEQFRKTKTFGGKEQNIFNAAVILYSGSVYMVEAQGWFWFRKRWSLLGEKRLPIALKRLKESLTAPVSELDLATVNNLYIGMEHETARNANMRQLCSKWFSKAKYTERVDGIKIPGFGRVSSLPLAHARALERGLTIADNSKFQPFLILENDCSEYRSPELHKLFVDGSLLLRYPSDADGIFLGITDCAVHPKLPIDLPATELQRVSIPHIPGLYRIFNMLSNHAYLVLTPRYARALKDCMIEASARKIQCDTLTARLGLTYNVYAYGGPPLFYQSSLLGGQEIQTKTRWDSNLAPTSIEGSIVPLTDLF